MRTFSGTKTLVRLFVTVLCSLSFQAKLYGQAVDPNNVRFEHIFTEDGLSNNMVLCALQDQKGFMWFGTADGLNRYDGYSFKIHTYDVRDPNSLSHCTVRSLYEDDSGIMWIGTSNGLNRFDPETEQFTRCQIDSNDSGCGNIRNPRINTIFEDSSGVLWLGTIGQGVIRYEKQGGKSHCFQHDPDNSASLSTNGVFAICEDDCGSIWVGTNQGLNRFDRGSGSFIRYMHDYYDTNSLASDSVVALTKDHAGTIWVGTYGGLNTLVPTGTHSPGKANSSFSYIISRYIDETTIRPMTGPIHEDSAGNMWVVKEDELYIYDRDRQVQTTYEWGVHKSNGYDFDKIFCIAEDRTGIMWFGTSQGIYKYDRQRKPFRHYKHEPASPDSLSSSYVTSIYKSRRDRNILWIGTHGGLNRLDRGTGKFTHYRHDPNKPESLSAYEIHSVVEDRSGAVWAGSWRLDKLSPGADSSYPDRFVHYEQNSENPSDPYGLSSWTVWSLYEDRQGALWVGTMDGLNRMIPAEQEWGQSTFVRYKRYSVDDVPRESMRREWIESIYQDEAGVVWVNANGLCRVVESPHAPMEGNENKPGDSFCYYSLVPNQPQDLIVAQAYTIHESKHGVLWIGTEGAGLFRYDSERNIFRQYTVQDGLASMVIWGILEDNSGNLWLSGNNGLSRFNPKTEECRNYNRYDGLQGNQFTMRAYHQGEDGEMFFGGVNGFNAFYPEDIKDNPFMPAVAITDFKIANKSVSTGKQEDGRTILNKSITATNEIELSYKDNVEFQFAALHYAASENNKYAYMLEGFDNGWNYTDAQHRFAIYKNMNPGKYVFKVKASNNDGLWNEEGVSLQIIVIPPFWQTAWFKSVCGLLALAGLIGIYEIKVRAIKAHKVALEAQVVKRTSELEEATEALKKSNEERIEHALQLQRMEAEHVHQIDLMKLRFFTNISHEFRTPLTLILGPLEKMLSGGETSRKHLAMMYRNAQNLQRLMNQILDFRKLESGKLKLEASFGDIIEFIAKIVDSFQPLADRKNIDYKFRSSVEILEGWFDTDKLDKILCNLLANALKFTPDGGKVSIFVKSVTCSKTGEHHNSALSSEKWVHIKVCDTGIGVDANKIRLLFDRFYQVDDQSTRQFEGTGIGLALAKDLVELHYGSIEVTSEKGEGSTFIVKIPIGKEYLKSDEVIEHVLPLGSESAGAKIPILDIAAGSPAEEAAYQNMEEQQSAPVILIVEDNADMRSYICDELSSQYRVCQAADGIEGMDKAFESVPDLIIADVMMPQMNGEQMCQRLKSDERTNHIPLIMLTARSSEEHTIQGLESGADDYIAKPFNMQILKTRVSNLLDSRRKLREKYSRQIWLEPNDIAMESVDEKFLRRAMEIVEEHMSDSQFGVEMFSKNLFMSRMNLYRKLKALTGQTPNQFIRTLRLKKAAKLLVECGMSVTEAMYEVGFNSFSYFRKVFREQFGLPPAEYAASQRQGKTEQLKPGI